jgi:hypothetical protein
MHVSCMLCVTGVPFAVQGHLKQLKHLVGAKPFLNEGRCLKNIVYPGDLAYQRE